MKTTTLKQIFWTLTSALLVSACAQQPLTSSLVKYQANSVQALQNYAGNVSKGFRGASNSSRGLSPVGPTGSQDLFQGYLLRQQTHEEVQACKDAMDSITPSCANLNNMAATLARCLNRIISDRNPILAYSYRQLNTQGQNYWGYLLNWHRPSTLDTFSSLDFNILNQFASQGFTDQDWR